MKYTRLSIAIGMLISLPICQTSFSMFNALQKAKEKLLKPYVHIDQLVNITTKALLTGETPAQPDLIAIIKPEPIAQIAGISIEGAQELKNSVLSQAEELNILQRYLTGSTPTIKAELRGIMRGILSANVAMLGYYAYQHPNIQFFQKETFILAMLALVLYKLQQQVKIRHCSSFEHVVLESLVPKAKCWLHKLGQYAQQSIEQEEQALPLESPQHEHTN